VVILTSSSSSAYQEVMEGLRGYMKSHRPGDRIDVHDLSDGDGARTRVLDMFERDPPSLIVTLGNPATAMALTDVPDVPVVATMILDMANVRRAENATGVSLEFPLETSLTWLTRILPERQAVGVLFDPSLNRETVDAAGVVASRLGFELQSEEVATPRDLRVALEQLARRSDVFWGIPDQTVLSPQTAQQVLLFSFRHQIPFVGLSSEWVKAGALYALDRDYQDVGKQCGGLVARILGGTRAHLLPPQTPRTVVYDLNLRMAETMNLTLPADVIDGARAVVK
jgi:putative ABC transport system substrate-binding protein